VLHERREIARASGDRGAQIGDLDRRANDARAVKSLLPAGACAEEGHVIAAEAGLLGKRRKRAAASRNGGWPCRQS